MMGSKIWKKFTYLYVILCSIDVLALSLDASISWLHIFVKPILMLVPIVFILRKLRAKKYFSWILAAFIFSWFGDVFLLGQEFTPLFFIAGLASFLLAHIFYIVLFTKGRSSKELKPKWINYIIAFTFLYAIVYYAYLLPYLKDLTIPVLLYVLVIALMGLSALWRYGSVNDKAFRITAYGAYSFILSDSILAFNKFVFSFDMADALIMTSYCLAQYLILKGFVALEEL